MLLDCRALEVACLKVANGPVLYIKLQVFVCLRFFDLQFTLLTNPQAYLRSGNALYAAQADRKLHSLYI